LIQQQQQKRYLIEKEYSILMAYHGMTTAQTIKAIGSEITNTVMPVSKTILITLLPSPSLAK
jgi:hypothetical protein